MSSGGSYSIPWCSHPVKRMTGIYRTRAKRYTPTPNRRPGRGARAGGASGGSSSTNGTTIHNVTIHDDTVPPGSEALSEALRFSEEILRNVEPNEVPLGNIALFEGVTKSVVDHIRSKYLSPFIKKYDHADCVGDTKNQPRITRLFVCFSHIVINSLRDTQHQFPL